MKSTRVSALVIGLVVLGVGCSSEEQPAPTNSSKSVSSPTTQASPTALTREQGAEKYLELVEPYNEGLDKCLPVVNPILDEGIVKSGDFSKIRKACKDMPSVNRQFADEVGKVPWPAEAQESISLLIDETRADQLAWQELSEVETEDDLFDPKYPLTQDGEAAGLVRAHLGLPPVEEIEE
jgi:hypothetical protein